MDTTTLAWLSRFLAGSFHGRLGMISFLMTLVAFIGNELVLSSVSPGVPSAAATTTDTAATPATATLALALRTVVASSTSSSCSTIAILLSILTSTMLSLHSSWYMLEQSPFSSTIVDYKFYWYNYNNNNKYGSINSIIYTVLSSFAMICSDTDNDNNNNNNSNQGRGRSESSKFDTDTDNDDDTDDKKSKQMIGNKERNTISNSTSMDTFCSKKTKLITIKVVAPHRGAFHRTSIIMQYANTRLVQLLLYRHHHNTDTYEYYGHPLVWTMVTLGCLRMVIPLDKLYDNTIAIIHNNNNRNTIRRQVLGFIFVVKKILNTLRATTAVATTTTVGITNNTNIDYYHTNTITGTSTQKGIMTADDTAASWLLPAKGRSDKKVIINNNNNKNNNNNNNKNKNKLPGFWRNGNSYCFVLPMIIGVVGDFIMTAWCQYQYKNNAYYDYDDDYNRNHDHNQSLSPAQYSIFQFHTKFWLSIRHLLILQLAAHLIAFSFTLVFRNRTMMRKEKKQRPNNSSSSSNTTTTTTTNNIKINIVRSSNGNGNGSNNNTNDNLKRNTYWYYYYSTSKLQYYYYYYYHHLYYYGRQITKYCTTAAFNIRTLYWVCTIGVYVLLFFGSIKATGTIQALLLD